LSVEQNLWHDAAGCSEQEHPKIVFWWQILTLVLDNCDAHLGECKRGLQLLGLCELTVQKPTEMPFSGQTCVGSRHYVLGGSAYWNHLANRAEQSVCSVKKWAVQKWLNSLR